MKVFSPNKDLHLVVELLFWTRFKVEDEKNKFKAWGFPTYLSSVKEASNPCFKTGLPLVHTYPKGEARWSPNFFHCGSPTWLRTFFRPWILILIPFLLWDHKTKIQNFQDQQTPSGQKQIPSSLTSLGFCFPFSFDLIIPGNSLQRAFLSALWCFNKMLFLLYPAVLALFNWSVGPKKPSLLFLSIETANP